MWSATAVVKWAGPIGLAGAAAVVLFTRDQWQQIVVASIAIIPAVWLGVLNYRQTKRDKQVSADRESTRLRNEKAKDNREAFERAQAHHFKVHDNLIEDLRAELDRLRVEVTATRADAEDARAKVRALEDSERTLSIRVADLERVLADLEHGAGRLVGQLETNGLDPVWRPAPRGTG